MKYNDNQLVYVSQDNLFTYGNVVSEDQDFVTIKPMSGEEKEYPHECVFSNQDDALIDYKANNNLK